MNLNKNDGEKLKKINGEIKDELQSNIKYNKLLKRKKQILNFLKAISEDDETRELLKNYEILSDNIKKLEIEMAFKVNEEIVCKKTKGNEEEYEIRFNKILEDDSYRKKLEKHKIIFKELISSLKEYKKQLYELESIDTQIATIETEMVRFYKK